ncbi:MAG: T9SS type A sorting domain-containing protein, partial [Pedobacter sp.]
AVSLVQGVYKFELTVTDNSGATAKDTMQVSVNPAANIPPVANAGGDKTITLPVNTTVLNGSGMDADGTISGYFWTKLSGPAAGDIINATSAVTNITNLVEAVYTFELRVTDNNGAIGRDTIRVTVLPAVPQNNQLPVANAGNNISITLPENSTALSGSGSDPDGMIVGYSWAKIAGPSAGNVMNATAASAMASGLVQGIYLFELKVTDNSGGTGRDTVQVTVHPAVSVPNTAPIANAGPDSTITLPENRLRLQGSGMDTDGSIVNYQWRILSGPIHYFLANANDPRSEFSELEEGIYKLELLVTDDDGAIGRDTVIISIAEGLDKPDVNTVDIYPNPVPDMMRARIGSITESEVMLVLYDSKGGTLFSKRIVTVAGQQVESIPMQKYAHGTYFLEITFRGQKPIMKKILKL